MLVWTFKEIYGGVQCECICCVCCVECVCICCNKVCLERLLAVTLDGSNSFAGECTLTKVQAHSSQPQKLQHREKNKNITTTLFFMDIACVHLAKVTRKGVINIARIIDNNQIKYGNSETILPPRKHKILFVTNHMKCVLEDCFSCAFEHKSKQANSDCVW